MDSITANTATSRRLKLYNRGQHSTVYRGEVVLHSDGRMTWADSQHDVQRWHCDFTSDGE